MILRSLLKNTAARSAAEIMNRLGSALLWIMIARALGASALGALVFALSLFSLFLSISTLGLGAVLIREVARDRKKAGLYFGHMLVLGAISSSLAAALMCGVALLIRPNPETIFASFVLALAVIPASGFYWSKALLSAAERMSKIAVARAVENIFKVCFGLFLLITGAGLHEIAFVIFLSKLISAIVIYFFARKIAKPVFKFDLSIIHLLIKLLPQFSLIAIFNSLFWTLPVILLTLLSGEKQAGLFSAAYKLVDVFISFALAYGQALFPIAAKTARENYVMFKLLCARSLKYVSLLTFGIAVGTTVIAQNLVQIIYGSDMTDIVLVLQILIWMIVPFANVPILAYTLVSHDLQKKDLLANVVSTCSLVVLSIIFIPNLGAVGMAIVLCVSSFAFMLVEFISVQIDLFKIHINSNIWKPLLGGGLMAGLILFINIQNLFFNIIIGALSYLLFLWFSRFITKSEIEMAKKLRSA